MTLARAIRILEGAFALGIVMISTTLVVLHGLVPRRRRGGRGLLALDTSYSLHLIEERGLETAVTALDLDGFFDHVWFVHPLVGASPDHPPRTGVGPVGSSDLTARHTVVEGRIASRRYLERLPILNFVLAQVALMFHLERLMASGRVAVVRAGDPHYKGLLGLFLARLHGVPLVVRIGGNFDEIYEITGTPANPRLIRSRRVEKFIEHAVLARADLVVGANQNSLAFAVENGADPDQTAVFRYGNLIHPVHFEEPDRRDGKSDPRAELGLARDQPLIVYVGRVEPVKRPEDIVHAMTLVTDEHPDAAAVLVGDGTMRHELERLAHKLGVEENVVFAGYRDQTWIGRLLPSATAALSPHMGRALVEVALGGVPIVAYDRDWHAEFVEPGVTGYLVPVGNVEGLAERSCQLLSNPEQAARMGTLARERAREIMDPKRLTEHERRTYRSLLDRGQDRPI